MIERDDDTWEKRRNGRRLDTCYVVGGNRWHEQRCHRESLCNESNDTCRTMLNRFKDSWAMIDK